MGYDFDLQMLMSGTGTARVIVSGDLDMAVAEVLTTAISGALRTDGIWLVEMDLSGLRFLDACGLSALLAARNDAQAMEKTFRIRGMNGLPLRVLEITGALGILSGKLVEDAG
jgi:anti-anti-sigma factor